MKELIKDIQGKWKVAKDAAKRKCEASGNLEMARKLDECEMFKGTENLEQLISLMFTPKGIEFLTTYNFPDLETFRKFKKYHPERFGIYIDCGKIALSDNKKVFLVGSTTATLNYRETAANRVYLMHGASASVVASGFSVVKIERDATCEVKCNVRDNAKVLW